MSKPALVLKTVRSEHVDLEFFGYLAVFNKNGAKYFYPHNTKELSEKIFFMRSLAKPIQASIMADFAETFHLTDKQVAITCASHTGEKYHTQVVLSILKKFNLTKNHLMCHTHPPIGKNRAKPEPVHNNCSGKHALMLALCKAQGWSCDNYLEFEHPIQQHIFKKHQELCGYKDLILSLDGCMAPVFGMPFENIAKGYLNLFLDDKYNMIKRAFLNYPKLIGGKERLDTKIMKKNPALIAKVGAGGFLAVLNLQTQELLLVKMSQDNNVPREITASEALLQLGWIKTPLALKDILTLAGKKTAEYRACFNIS